MRKFGTIDQCSQIEQSFKNINLEVMRVNWYFQKHWSLAPGAVRLPLFGPLPRSRFCSITLVVLYKQTLSRSHLLSCSHFYKVKKNHINQFYSFLAALIVKVDRIHLPTSHGWVISDEGKSRHIHQYNDRVKFWLKNSWVKLPLLASLHSQFYFGWSWKFCFTFQLVVCFSTEQTCKINTDEEMTYPQWWVRVYPNPAK